MMNALEKLFLLIDVMCQMQGGSFVVLCEVQAQSLDTLLCNLQTMLCALSSVMSSLMHLSSMTGPPHDTLLSVVDMLGHSNLSYQFCKYCTILPYPQLLQ